MAYQLAIRLDTSLQIQSEWSKPEERQGFPKQAKASGIVPDPSFRSSTKPGIYKNYHTYTEGLS